MFFPSQLRLPALLALCVAVAPAVAADLCQPIRLAAAPLALPDKLEVQGNAAVDETGKWTLSEDGEPFEIRMGDRVVRGTKATLDAQGNLQFDGDFSYQDPTILLRGQSGSLEDSGATASDASFELLQQPGRGEAKMIRQTATGALELDRVSYTSCPKNATDWILRSQRITLDLDRERGVGRNTRVEFKGIPVLYLPWISFPLSSTRQSGLLFPTFGSSTRNGATFSLPWYLNLAPNRDLTLTPTIYTRRGLNLGAEFRLLQLRGQGTLQLDWLPLDRIANASRNHVKLDTSWKLPADWRFSINAERVGDSQYFEDFTQGTQVSSTAFLAQRIELTRRSDAWRLGAVALQFQTLDESLQALDRPYAQLPQLSARGRFDLANNFRAILESELVNFSRAAGVEGWRALLTPNLSWQYTKPGYFVRPSLSWNLSQYQLRRVAAGMSAAPTLNVPELIFDAGLNLQRAVGRNQNRQLTLEPRLLYVNIPYRDQTQLPIFDSGLPDPNFVALFRPNRYVGVDRIGDANRLALGVTTRMYESTTGQQYLNATFGESFNFQTPRVSLPNETLDTRQRSSLVANVDLRGYRQFGMRLDMAWNPELSSTEKLQVTLQYLKAGNQLINLGYRFDRNNGVRQLDASGVWPVGQRWEVYGRSVYSLQDRNSIDNFAGLRFRGDCWGLRAVVRRSISSRDGQRETGIYLQFELSGLSSVGTGADTFLQQSIQGYSAAKSVHPAQPVEP
jgi:LPS-assembly protein